MRLYKVNNGGTIINLDYISAIHPVEGGYRLYLLEKDPGIFITKEIYQEILAL